MSREQKIQKLLRNKPRKSFIISTTRLNFLLNFFYEVQLKFK